MFKRPRLSTPIRLVNASLVLGLLFLVPACSKPAEESVSTLPEAENSAAETDMELPAVWSTRDLGTPIASIGVAGELGSTIAVAYEDGDVQLINFEGDRITEKTDLGIAAFADGRYQMLSGVPVTLFPAITTGGQLQVMIHGGELPAPLAYELDTGVAGSVSGLCTAPPSSETDGVMRLGFWTEDAPTTLQSGRLVEVAEELVFLADEPVAADRPIAACLLTDVGATVYAAPARSAMALRRRGREHILTLDTSGNLTVTTDQNQTQTLGIRDGITIRMPELAIDLAGTGDSRGGGYPGGLIVVAGEDPNGDNRLIFIDPSQLTLTPFQVPVQ